MSVLDLFGTARDLGRCQEIAAVFLKHGMGDVVQRIGLGGLFARAGRVLRMNPERVVRDLPTERRLRLSFEELGPTFVKLGQLLASRGDLLSPEWRAELAGLTEQVAPVPFEELLPQLTEHLGAPPDEVFDALQREPLAAGSLGQVHRARTHAGDEVVLKIRRPGVRPLVEADLRIAARIAELLESELPETRRFAPVRLVRHFARVLRDELDFATEARNTVALRSQLVSHAAVSVPRVYEEYGCERLLVLEFFRGTSAYQWASSDRSAEAEAGGEGAGEGAGECAGEGVAEGAGGSAVDGPFLAKAGTDAVLEMIFEHGLYHADPHPGNVLFLGPRQLGLIDCGMVGRLTPERRSEFLGLLAAAVQRDGRRMCDLLMRWSDGKVEIDEDQFAFDLRGLCERYFDASLAEFDVTEALSEILSIVRNNGLVLPPDVASLLRVMVLLESLGHSLDPQFKLGPALEPFVRSQAFGWRGALQGLGDGAEDLYRLLLDLPGDLRGLLRRARSGSVKLDLDLERLERFGAQIDRSANRLTVGIVTAALIVGTSIAATAESGPFLFGLPAIGFLGFLSSLALALYLLAGIARGKR